MTQDPQPDRNAIEDLLLEAALDPTCPTDQMAAELRKAGVDLDGILKRTGALIGSRVRAHLQASAAGVNQVHLEALAATRAEIAGWPVDRIRQWLQEVAEGIHGAAHRALAQPCFRNRTAAEMTEEELRNLAAEIKATMQSADDR